MKIVFKDLGVTKFSKIVEVANIIGYENIKEFCEMEIEPHLPEVGEFELVPIDGNPDLVSNNFVVVHHDGYYVARSMGNITIYQ